MHLQYNKEKNYITNQLCKEIFLISFIFFVLFPLFSEEVISLSDGRTIILFDDHTWAELDSIEKENKDIIFEIKQFLRRNISASDEEIYIACEMYDQGWTYTMPRPKSSQAAWGNYDRRTTWYKGWWYNSITEIYSETTPVKTESGLYLGDGQISKNFWRNGGSPVMPDVFMFLLSQQGGPLFR